MHLITWLVPPLYQSLFLTCTHSHWAAMFEKTWKAEKLHKTVKKWLYPEDFHEIKSIFIILVKFWFHFPLLIIFSFNIYFLKGLNSGAAPNQHYETVERGFPLLILFSSKAKMLPANQSKMLILQHWSTTGEDENPWCFQLWNPQD